MVASAGGIFGDETREFLTLQLSQTLYTAKVCCVQNASGVLTASNGFVRGMLRAVAAILNLLPCPVDFLLVQG